MNASVNERNRRTNDVTILIVARVDRSLDEDLGTGRGRRVGCTLCRHTWFQSRERLYNVNKGYELVALPDRVVARINSNIAAGRDPDFSGGVKFYVGNLSFKITPEDIYETFSKMGEVCDVNIVIGADGRSRGFAFVSMIDKDCEAACLTLDGAEVLGRNINVNVSNK